MNEKTYSIRRFKMSDINKVVDLLNIVFEPEIPFTSEWWNWKYILNPAGFSGENGDIWVAENGDKLVGYYAVIPEKFIFNNRTITVAQSVDTAVHPEYRRMGMFSALAEKVYSEVKNRYYFIFGFPSGMAYLGFLKLGWKDFEIDEYIKFINYEDSLNRITNNNLLSLFSKYALKTWSTLVSLKHLFYNIRGMNVEIQKVNKFHDEINYLWKKVKSKNIMILERDIDFLNWRFSKIFGDYHIYIGRSTKDKSIVGYAVFKKTHIPPLYKIYDIVDLCASPGEDKFISDILKLAIDETKKLGLNAIHCRVPNWHKYANILSKFGFIKTNRFLKMLKLYQPRAIFLDFGEKRTIPGKLEWFYTLADTDYA